MPTTLSLNLKGTIPLDKKGTVISILFSGDNTRNYITTKTEYFTEETFLPQYNYTIAKGATLTTRMNVPESWNLNSSVKLSMRLLKTKVNLGLVYGYEKTPSYIDKELCTLTANKYSGTLDFNTAFSSHFDVSFKSSNIWMRSFNGKTKNNSFTENLTVEPRFQLGNRSKFILSGNYYHYGNRQLAGTERNDFILNSSITCRLDKQGNFSLGLQVNDIFNQRRSFSINLGEDYTSTVQTLLPGRYWLLKAEYKF